MKNVKVIIALAVLIVVVPFSGLPSLWKTVLLVALGAIIALLAYRLLSVRKSSVDSDTLAGKEQSQAGGEEEEENTETGKEHG